MREKIRVKCNPYVDVIDYLKIKVKMNGDFPHHP